MIATTQNEAWGFFGSMGEHANAAWPIAVAAISTATSQSIESVRAFLDSRHGRHFADDVQNGLYQGQTLADAVTTATQQWMGWRISRQTSKQYGMPQGLPYLTAFVIQCEIEEDLIAE